MSKLVSCFILIFVGEAKRGRQPERRGRGESGDEARARWASPALCRLFQLFCVFQSAGWFGREQVMEGRGQPSQALLKGGLGTAGSILVLVPPLPAPCAPQKLGPGAAVRRGSEAAKLQGSSKLGFLA